MAKNTGSMDKFVDTVVNKAVPLLGGGGGSGAPSSSGGSDNPFLIPAVEDKLPPYIGGMGEGYTTPSSQWHGLNLPVVSKQVSPIYRADDEFNLLGSMSETQRQRVQQALIDAGMVDPNAIQFGSIDPATVRGFEAVLGYANMNGKSWQDILFSSSGQRLLGAGSGSGSGGGKAPLRTQITDSDALRRVFKKTMVEMAGSKVEGFDVDAAVSAYQQAERAFQQQSYAQQTTGGETMTPPSAQDFISGQLEEQAGNQVQANSMAERAGQLVNLIKGGF